MEPLKPETLDYEPLLRKPPVPPHTKIATWFALATSALAITIFAIPVIPTRWFGVWIDRTVGWWGLPFAILLFVPSVVGLNAALSAETRMGFRIVLYLCLAALLVMPFAAIGCMLFRL